MSHDSKNEVPIPDPWRKTVAAILRRGDRNEIIVKDRPRLEFEARFPDAWSFDRNSAMAAALEQKGVKGLKVTDMADPGEVWAFWFYFRNVKLYGKINLTPSGKVIIVYSAHVPNKGDEKL